MLAMTDEAREAIDAVTADHDGGLRISAALHSLNGDGPVLALELVPSPGPDDEVVDVGESWLYLDAETSDMLDGKLLDADFDGRNIRFSIVEPD
jgi:Fe-S cluster assembly iron-binding protein IscA